jgi:hypothetical protein
VMRQNQHLRPQSLRSATAQHFPLAAFFHVSAKQGQAFTPPDQTGRYGKVVILAPGRG